MGISARSIFDQAVNRGKAHEGAFGRDRARVRARVGGIERVTSERGYLTRYVTWIRWCACEDAWDTWDGEAGPGSGIGR